MAGNFPLQNLFRYGHMIQTYHQLPFNFMRCDSTMFMLIFFLEGLQLLFFPSFTLFFQLLLLLLLPELLSRKKKSVPASRIKKVKSLFISLHTMNAWGKGDIAPLILNFSTRQMQLIRFMTQPLFFFNGSTTLLGLGLLIVEVLRSHSDTPHR